MKNTIVKFGGVLPKILENTTLNLSLSGWPATIAIGFVCVAGVLCFAIYEEAKQTDTEKPDAKQEGSETEQAGPETEQVKAATDQAEPNAELSNAVPSEVRQTETGQVETGQSEAEQPETAQMTTGPTELKLDSFAQISPPAA